MSGPQGGYFVIADAAPLGHTDAAAFCKRESVLADAASRLAALGR